MKIEAWTSQDNQYFGALTDGVLELSVESQRKLIQRNLEVLANGNDNKERADG